MNHGTPAPWPEGSANDGDLLRFLSNEFLLQGIVAAEEPLADSHGVADWTLSRDEYGFIVTVPGDCESLLRDYLECLFGSPCFHHDRTRIYRNDHRKVSAMLNGPTPTSDDPDSTQLIVLLFQDPAVEQQISERCEQAIERLFTEALAETNAMMDELQQEVDESRQLALLDSIEAKLTDIDETLRNQTRHLGTKRQEGQA